MRKVLMTAVLCCVFSCSQPVPKTALQQIGPAQIETVAIPPPDIPINTEEDPEVPYQGKTIDEVFPLIKHYDFQDATMREADFDVEISGLRVGFSRFAPQSIKRGKTVVFRYKVKTPGDYWSGLVGTANLLGPSTSQIYVEATGPGGVCCTNFWITDVSGTTPRNIFRSEDYGSFRSPMEVFDSEGDGIYELIQFDSCMRYFRDDCGSCSPEPRVYFKYDKSTKEYRPAQSIQPEYVKDAMAAAKKWLYEKKSELKTTTDPGAELDLRRSVISYVADLLHMGYEKQAWSTMNAFREVVDAKDDKEIRLRLKSCKFYQALKRIREPAA